MEYTKKQLEGHWIVLKDDSLVHADYSRDGKRVEIRMFSEEKNITMVMDWDTFVFFRHKLKRMNEQQRRYMIQFNKKRDREKQNGESKTD